MSKYKTLQRNPLLQSQWGRAFGKYFGNFAQVDAMLEQKAQTKYFSLTKGHQEHPPQTNCDTQVVVDY